MSTPFFWLMARAAIWNCGSVNTPIRASCVGDRESPATDWEVLELEAMSPSMPGWPRIAPELRRPADMMVPFTLPPARPL